MKKSLLIITCILITNVSLAQWAGPTNTTDDINRTGDVGLGTTNPEAPLHISQTGPEALRFQRSGHDTYALYLGGAQGLYFHNLTDGRRELTFDGSGKIGIGTINPTEKLHVIGNGQFSTGVKWGTNSNLSNNGGASMTLAGDNSSATPFIDFYNDFSGGIDARFILAADNTLALNFANLGIGTNNAIEKLTVNGKILCEEVEVIQDVLPDYVFQKYYNGFSLLKEDYKMPTLEEVEAFIKVNYHLPEVPSAAEVKENGMQLKEMTTLLLQKVEELTLYTIEQEKRIKTLEAKLVKQ